MQNMERTIQHKRSLLVDKKRRLRQFHLQQYWPSPPRKRTRSRRSTCGAPRGPKGGKKRTKTRRSNIVKTRQKYPLVQSDTHHDEMEWGYRSRRDRMCCVIPFQLCDTPPRDSMSNHNSEGEPCIHQQTQGDTLPQKGLYTVDYEMGGLVCPMVWNYCKTYSTLFQSKADGDRSRAKRVRYDDIYTPPSIWSYSRNTSKLSIQYPTQFSSKLTLILRWGRSVPIDDGSDGNIDGGCKKRSIWYSSQ